MEYIPLLILAGIFYFLVLPVLVIVALNRTSKREDEINDFRSRMVDVEESLRKLLDKAEYGGKDSAQSDAASAAETIPQQTAPTTHQGPVFMAQTFNPPPIIPPPAPTLNIQSPRFKAIPTVPARTSPPPRIAETPPDQNLEIRLGAWWATRLGIAFLIIAVVFFGVYISMNAHPWVRLVEVCAVAVIVTLAGRWLERKTPVFGQVMYAGGLALFYFAAFAAHALAPMRVIESLFAGLALQFVAVAVLTAIALWRNRSSVAAMAIFLGALSCAFALNNGEIEVTLLAASGLVVAGAFLRVARGWTWPLAFGYVGGQLNYAAAVLVSTGHTLNASFLINSQSPKALAPGGISPEFTLLCPLGFFILLATSDILGQMAGRAGARIVREYSMRCAALALGLGGWWGGAAMDGVLGNTHWASINLLTATAACLAAGIVYWRRKDLDTLSETLVAAAGTWLAVYFINEYAGWIRWLAVLAESFVFAGWVRRRGSAVTWLCLIAAWAVSGILAIMDAQGIHSDVPTWAVLRFAYAGWSLISVGLWTWVQRSPRALSDDEHRLITYMGGLFTGLTGTLLVLMASQHEMLPWFPLALAVLATILAAGFNANVAWPLAGFSLIAVLAIYWPQPGDSTGTVLGALAGLSIAALAYSALRNKRASTPEDHSWAIAGEIVFSLLLLKDWYVGIDYLKPGYVPLGLTLAALCLTSLAWTGRWRMLADIAFVWAGVGLADLWIKHLAQDVTLARSCLVAILATAWIWGALARREKSPLTLLRFDVAGKFLPSLLLAAWTWESLPANWPHWEIALTLAGAALVYGAIAKREWLPSGTVAAGILGVMSWLYSVTLHPDTLAQSAATIGVAAVLLFLGMLTARRLPSGKLNRDTMLWILGLASLAAVDIPGLHLHEPDIKSLTLLWAAVAVMNFSCGLAGRLRVYRYTGFAGLALCIPRMFFVDITDTLGRIFAFGALAIVLLGIGFSYHKLRAWLTQLDSTVK